MEAGSAVPNQATVNRSINPIWLLSTPDIFTGAGERSSAPRVLYADP